jgi:hypothetical protein
LGGTTTTFRLRALSRRRRKKQLTGFVIREAAMFFLLLLFLLPFRLVKSLARKPSVVLEVCTRSVGFSLSLSVPSFLVFLFFLFWGDIP